MFDDSLAALLRSGEQMLVPGVYDALSAKIASQSGFTCLYMSGFAVAGSLLAKPDIGLVTASEMKEVRAAFPDVPLVANMVEEGKTPDLTAKQLADLGYQIILRPVSALLAASRALQTSYHALSKTSRLASEQSRLTFDEFNTLVGLDTTLV